MRSYTTRLENAHDYKTVKKTKFTFFYKWSMQLPFVNLQMSLGKSALWEFSRRANQMNKQVMILLSPFGEFFDLSMEISLRFCCRMSFMKLQIAFRLHDTDVILFLHWSQRI